MFNVRVNAAWIRRRRPPPACRLTALPEFLYDSVVVSRTRRPTEVPNVSPAVGRIGFSLVIAAVYALVARSFAAIPAFTSFAAIFLSIVLEGFPFILLGSLVGSTVETLLPPDRIAATSRKFGVLGIPVAALAGIAMPLCECAIVPTMRSLRTKGMSLPQAITFMIGVPLLNPIVLASTIAAFPRRPDIVAARFGGGLIVVPLVGFIFFLWDLRRAPRGDAPPVLETPQVAERPRTNVKDALLSILHHATEQFVEILAVFSIGALLSSLMQVVLPFSWLNLFQDRLLLSILLMIAFAFLLSVCSEADAFIAKAFVPIMPVSSVLAFLVFGPMLDLKNVLLLRRVVSRSELALLTIALLVSVTTLGWVYGTFV